MVYERSVQEEEPVIIAVTGKGGVGKTSISAVIVKLLVESYPDKKVIAIDADPAIGLSTALGVEASVTLDDIRKEVIDAAESGGATAAVELIGEAKYRLYEAIAEGDGFALMAIGRPEAQGCYCKVNSYLRDVIQILSKNFDYVVIDGEAGIEQVNRRVMERVTHLMLVSDCSRKGIQVINTIKKVADELVMYDRLGAVINRLQNPEDKEYLDTGDIPVLSFIEEDRILSSFDLRGENVFYLPNDTEVVIGVRDALINIGIIKGAVVV